MAKAKEEKAVISPVVAEFGREDLNALRDTVNALVDFANGVD